MPRLQPDTAVNKGTGPMQDIVLLYGLNIFPEMGGIVSYDPVAKVHGGSWQHGSTQLLTVPIAPGADGDVVIAKAMLAVRGYELVDGPPTPGGWITEWLEGRQEDAAEAVEAR